MISTVTTSTVSTVSTVTIAGSLALVGILVLLALVVQKELSTASNTERARKFSQALNIGIVPLIIAFILTVVFKTLELLK